MDNSSDSNYCLNREGYLDEIKSRGSVAEKSFFFYLSFVAYTLITTFGISDRQLLFRQYGIELPIFNVDISIELFLIVAPLLCVLFFVYYSYYLLSLKRLIHSYRTKYSDNKGEFEGSWIIVFDSSTENLQDELERANIPEGGWLAFLTGFLTKFIRGLMYNGVRSIINILHIWLLPITLMLIGLKYARLHQIFWELFFGCNALILLVLNYLQYIYLRYCPDELAKIRGEKGKRPLKALMKVVLVNLSIIMFASIFIYGYVTSVTLGHKGKLSYFLGVKALKLRNVLDLSYVDLTQQKSQFLPFWGRLEGIDLKGANLEGAILIKMNIEKCDFTGADLTGADLRGARVRDSIFDEVNFSDANFGFTNFSDTSFVGALFRRAKFIDNSISNVHLEGADFAHAKFLSVEFTEVRLEGANFNNAILADAIFKDVYLGYSNFKDALIQNCRFGANGSLVEVNLEGVNFSLKGVDNCDNFIELYDDESSDRGLFEEINMEKKFDDFIANFKLMFKYQGGDSIVYISTFAIEAVSIGKRHLKKMLYVRLNKGELEKVDIQEPNEDEWYSYRVKKMYELPGNKLAQLFRKGLPYHFRAPLTTEQLYELESMGISFKGKESL